MEKEVMKHPYNFAMLPVGRINVNHLYQRDEVPSTLRNILSNFDYHLVNPIKCVYRDGNYWAFDGQNTAIGLTMLFGSSYEAPVMLYNDISSAEEEAKLFEELNKSTFRKAASVADDLKSKLFRNDPNMTSLRSVLQANGLDVANETNKGKAGVIPNSLLKCVLHLYKTMNEAHFQETMSIFGGAWRYDRDAYRVPIIKALALFVKTYYGEYRKKDLIDRLHNHGAKEILRSAQFATEAGVKKYAREMLYVYNYKTRANRLQNKL